MCEKGSTDTFEMELKRFLVHSKDSFSDILVLSPSTLRFTNRVDLGSLRGEHLYRLCYTFSAHIYYVGIKISPS